MVETLVTWLVRFIHVTAAAFWVGGYAVLALAIVPQLRDGASDQAVRAAVRAARTLTYAGAVTIVAGLLLISYSRGWGALIGGEWGGIVIGAFVVAIIMMGIGDGLLRPALQRLGSGDASAYAAARRWALVGLGLGVLALAMMTRAIYARG